MPIDAATKEVLARWRSLNAEGGLQRVVSVERALWVGGLLLSVFVAFAIFYKLHPVIIAGGSAVAGWVVAERNALRSRLLQWPIFKSYLDWKRVEADLRDAT